MDYRNEYHRLIGNLHKTAGRITNHFQQRLAPFDLSVQQYAVLRLLSKEHPDSLTAGELKAKMTDLNPDLTRLTDRLIAKGLILRDVDPQNRRRVMLMLTEAGHELVDRAAVEFSDFEAIISVLTPDEVATMNTLLDKIRINIA